MPIDINTLTYDTPLPVEMATFWPSINNKVKLQSMLIDCIIEEHKFQTVDVVISAIIGHEVMQQFAKEYLNLIRIFHQF